MSRVFGLPWCLVLNLFGYQTGYHGMPKPYLIKRPSGVFVRFFVPSNLQAPLGARYLVRRLPLPMGDAARLVAAQMAVALSQAFEAWRGGGMSNDELKAFASGLAALHTGKAKDYSITRHADGGVTITTDGTEKDHRNAMEAHAAMHPAAAAPVTPPPSPLLSTQITNYLTDLRNAGRSEGNILDSRNTLQLFLELTGDRPVGEVSAAHLRDFQTAMQDWPANARKLADFRDLKAPAIIATVRKMKKAGQVVECIAPRTKAKHRDRLATFFNTQVETDAITKTPLKGSPRATTTALQASEKSRRPFTTDELSNLLYAGNLDPWAKGKPHRFWGTWLGYYTGARVNEVAQLYVRDVYQNNGVWGVHFRPALADQKLKNPNSSRFVPLHPALLNAGLLDYLTDVKAAGHERLFPLLSWSKKAGYGDGLSDQFSTYTDHVGITEAGVAFHAFRHTLATALIGKSVTPHVVASITGHLAKLPGALGNYVEPAELPLLVEAINLLTCPHTPTPYQPGDAQESLGKAARKIRHTKARQARLRKA